MGELAGGARLEGLLDSLRLDRNGHLHRTATEAATIHETSFFRDARVFEAIRTEAIPKLMKARKVERRLRVWCAGCSTGQEVYSVAMLLREALAAVHGWNVAVLGTDIARPVIEYAEKGLYRPGEVSHGLAEGMLGRYFEAKAGDWAVGAAVKGMCSFECWNLCDPFPPLPVFDMVLMRNVLTYMDAECRDGVFKHVRRQMAADGYLVLGELEQAEEAVGSFDEEGSGEGYFYRPTASS